jgi:hypothetical protein
MRAVWYLLILLAPLPALAGLELDETVFTEPALGLRLRVPEGWSASTQTGYPGLLLLLQAPGHRSRMIIGVTELGKAKTLAQFAVENIAGLRALGMTVYRSQSTNQLGRTLWEIAAQAGGALELRQLYVVQGPRVFTISLAGPTAELARLQGDMLQAIAGMTFK